MYKKLFKVENIEKEEINEIDNNNNKSKDKMVIEEDDNIQNKERQNLNLRELVS